VLDAPDSGDPLNLGVTLYWRTPAPPAQDYTVFVQLLNEAGQLVAQKDNPPGQGLYPTSAWVADQIFADPYPIALPSALPAGSYRLIAGMYLYPSLERLPVTREGQIVGDFVEIESITLGTKE
jgi:hypothetical protein